MLTKMDCVWVYVVWMLGYFMGYGLRASMPSDSLKGNKNG
jgi:hypothetical protein